MLLESLALTIGIHIHSYHWANRPEYNNNNVGLYVRTKQWQLGTYLNTFEKQTVYLGYNIPIKRGLEFQVGGATGYKYKVTPFYMVNYKPTKHSRVFVNHEVVNFSLEF